jgi:hypothetical protein
MSGDSIHIDYPDVLSPICVRRKPLSQIHPIMLGAMHTKEELVNPTLVDCIVDVMVIT